MTKPRLSAGEMRALLLRTKVLGYEEQKTRQEHFNHSFMLAYSRCLRVLIQYKTKNICSLNYTLGGKI
jgi:hypothetical protein